MDLTDPDHPKSGSPQPFLRESAGVTDPAFSPDGRWFAYTLTTVPAQVFVRPFPSNFTSGKWQISTDGGRFPVWSRDGQHLFYLSTNAHVMVAAYQAKDASFIPGTARQWSSATIARTGDYMPFDLAPDGKRMIALLQQVAKSERSDSVHITVLLNFFDELKRKVR
jgi:Tol biopolymer transport system component